MYRDEYQYWRERDGGPVAQGMTGRVMRSGLLKPGLEQKPLLNLNDGRRAPDWNEFTDQAAISILQGRPVSPTPTLPQQEQPERTAEPATATQTPARTDAATKQVWPNAWVANRLAHTYTLHAKDGRDWPKMIVGLPRGTAIDGQDLTGWATDMFMSAKNRRQKSEGRAVNLRFRPGTPVELFTGRGTERRTMQVDPQTLVQVIAAAQKRSRDAEQTLSLIHIYWTHAGLDSRAPPGSHACDPGFAGNGARPWAARYLRRPFRDFQASTPGRERSAGHGSSSQPRARVFGTACSMLRSGRASPDYPKAGTAHASSTARRGREAAPCPAKRCV